MASLNWREIWLELVKRGRSLQLPKGVFHREQELLIVAPHLDRDDSVRIRILRRQGQQLAHVVNREERVIVKSNGPFDVLLDQHVERSLNALFPKSPAELIERNIELV